MDDESVYDLILQDDPEQIKNCTEDLDVLNFRDEQLEWSIAHIAVACKAKEVLTWLADAYPSLFEVTTPLGETPSFLTAFYGYVDVFDHMSSLKVISKKTNIFEQNIIHAAVFSDNREMVERTLSYTTIDVKDDCGWTPLMYCLFTGNLDMFNYLVDAGASLQQCDNKGRNIIHYLASLSSELILQYCYSDQAVIADYASLTALLKQAIHILSKHSLDIPKVIKPDLMNRNPFHFSAIVGEAEAVGILFTLPADKSFIAKTLAVHDDEGLTPLFCALMHGHSMAAFKIIEQSDFTDITSTKKSGSVLHASVLARSPESVAMICAFCIAKDYNLEYKTVESAILAATASLSDNTLYKLSDLDPILRKRSDTLYRLQESRDENGHTPLHCAIRNKDLFSFYALIAAGSYKITEKDEKGRNYLQLAIEIGLPNAAMNLVQWGIPVDDMMPRTWLPIHLAADKGYHELVQAILVSTKNVEKCLNAITAPNDTYPGCETPLFLAAKNGHVETVRYLLKQGADYKYISKTFGGTTALHAAVVKSHSEIVYEIIKTAAENNDKTIVDMPIASDPALKPVHLACLVRDIYSLSSLISFGADSKAIDRAKSTPVHLLCYKIEEYVSLKSFGITRPELLQPKSLGSMITQLFNLCEAGSRSKAAIAASKTIDECYAILTKPIDQPLQLLSPVNYNNPLGSPMVSPGLMSPEREPISPSVLLATPVTSSVAPEEADPALLCAEGLSQAAISQGGVLDLDKKDIMGRTPLMLSCSDQGSPWLTSWLLNHGANLHLVDDFGRTALHYATTSAQANMDSLQSAAMLMCYGASVTAKDDDYRTCLQCTSETIAKLITSLNTEIMARIRKDKHPIAIPPNTVFYKPPEKPNKAFKPLAMGGLPYSNSDRFTIVNPFLLWNGNGSMPTREELIQRQPKKQKNDSKSADLIQLVSRPKWMDDDESDRCCNCDSQFSISRRRSHCRCCGLLHCSDCMSPNEVPIPYMGYHKPVKVCATCEILLTVDE